MSNRFQIGRYYPTDSVVHKMNSKVKIMCIMMCVIMLVLPHNILIDVIFLLGILFLIYVSKIPFKLYINSVLSLKFFLLGIFILNLLCGVSMELSFQMIFKICIMILYSQILVLTTSLQDMMSGISKIISLLKIFNVKTGQLTFCISLAILFIPLILEQTDGIMKSLTSRGIDYKKASFLGKLAIIRAIVFPIFISTLRRADRLAETLEVRGYNINSNYFYNIKEQLTIFDTFILGVHIFLFLILILGMIL